MAGLAEVAVADSAEGLAVDADPAVTVEDSAQPQTDSPAKRHNIRQNEVVVVRIDSGVF